MKLREILLAGAFLLSSAAFSQNKLHFDIYSKKEGFFNPRLNSSLNMDSKEIDFSFLHGMYSMKFKRINDSTYREIVKNNFFQSKEEVFDYSFRDSSCILDSYSAIGGKPREEKEVLEGTVFDKKYKSLPELFNDFEKGLLKDSIYLIVLGMPYSIKIENTEVDEDIIYSCKLKKPIKKEPGDFILFPYPIEVYAKRKNEKVIPLGFYTKFLNVRSGRNTSIEGELRKEKE
jgi:hypothetical protein